MSKEKENRPLTTEEKIVGLIALGTLVLILFGRRSKEPEKIEPISDVDRLNKELEVAVENEKFEDACVLRDKINQLKNDEKEV